MQSVKGQSRDDALGNVTLDPNNGRSYTYDAESRLTASGTYTYIYDADGVRVAKLNGGTVVAEYLFDNAGEQQIELDGSGNVVHTNVFAGGRLVATYKNDGQTYFHFTDRQGTRRMQMNASGQTTLTCTNLPFGDGLTCTGSPDATELHYTGKERDSESGLDEFGARYYSPAMGRFTIPDWAAKATAVPYANFGDPQSLNLYAYVGNSPVNRVDVDGHTVLFVPALFNSSPGPCPDAPCPAASDANANTPQSSDPEVKTTGQAQNACQSGNCNVKVIGDTGKDNGGAGTPNPFVAGVNQREVTYQAVDSKGNAVPGAEISLHETPLPGKEGGDAKSYNYASGKGQSNSTKGEETSHRAGQFTDLMTTGKSGPAGFRQTYTVEGKSANIIWPTQNGPVVAPSQKVLDSPDRIIIIPEVSQ